MARASLVALYRKDLEYLYSNIEKFYKNIHENLSEDLKNDEIEHTDMTDDADFLMDKCTRDIESAAKWMRSLHLAYQSACVHDLPIVVKMDLETYQSGEWLRRSIISCNCVEKEPHGFPAPSSHCSGHLGQIEQYYYFRTPETDMRFLTPCASPRAS